MNEESGTVLAELEEGYILHQVLIIVAEVSWLQNQRNFATDNQPFNVVEGAD